MAKKPITELRIRLFQPMADGDPYIALIGNLAMLFKGKTPMQAHAAAEKWRREETEKLKSKAQRKREQDAAAQKEEAQA